MKRKYKRTNSKPVPVFHGILNIQYEVQLWSGLVRMNMKLTNKLLAMPLISL